MKLFNLTLISAGLSLGLVACSDSSNNDSVDQPDAGTSKISESNAEKVVEIAFDSFEDLDFLSGAVQGGNFIDAAQMNPALEKNSSRPVIYCGGDPFTDTGAGSLDITISGDLITNFNFGIEFAVCQLTATASVDGAYNLNFAGNRLIGPQFGDGSSVTTQTFTNLTVNETELAFNALANGEIVSNVEFAAPVFTWQESVNLLLAETDNEISFSDWEKTISLNVDTGQLTLNMSGDFSATNQNGSFTLEMLQPLVFDAQLDNNNANATVILSGQFKVTAEDNSSVVVTIISATEAQLEIDEDGDGVIDSTITVSIDDLNIFDSIN